MADHQIPPAAHIMSDTDQAISPLPLLLPAPLSLPLPARIGPYAVAARLGGAGLAGAAVYLTQAGGARPAPVIKAVDKRAPGGAAAALSLRREAALAATLAHPHIVATRGYYEDTDWACLLMAPAGTTLAARLAPATGQAPAAGLAQAWMGQLLDALDYLHGRGVVHGDICPANILIGADHRLRLGDFGLARRATGAAPLTAALTAAPIAALAGDAAGNAAGNVGAIDTGGTQKWPAGTLSHMAPERLRGAAADMRSDLFAVTVVFYRLLAGHPPFAGSPFQILQAILAGKVAPASHPGKIFLTKFDSFMQHALAVDPASRLQNTQAFRTALSLFHDASACA
jgi:serine/threonine-protein kinase